MEAARNILQWPHKLSESRITAHFTVPGDPVSKQRPRTTTRNGKSVTYTPVSTKEAEEAIHPYFLEGRKRLLWDDLTRFGVRIFFFKKDHNRRDVDNMAKLVLDSLNKMAWNDDAQIDELILWRAHDRENPRTEVVVYELATTTTADIPCVVCGKLVRTYPSQQKDGARRFCSRVCVSVGFRMRTKRPCDNCGKDIEVIPVRARSTGRIFCSKTCQKAAQTVALVCFHCGVDFRRPRSLHRSGRTFCSVGCNAAFWREHRKWAAQGTCQTCGGPTSKANYTNCRPCFMESGGFRSPGRKRGVSRVEILVEELGPCK